MSVISTLVVKLTADTGSFRTAMSTAGKDAGKLGKAYKTGQVAAAAGLTAITAIATKSVGVYKDYGGAVNKLTALMNISTEDASRLVGQWKRYGIEASTGMTAVKFLSKNIVAAKSGNEDAIASFEQLGISMDDLKNLSAAQVMMKARDAMSMMDDKTQRTATTLKLFGRSGTEMLGWTKQAPEDIAAVNKSLEKLGLVWDDKKLQTYKDMAKAQGEMKLAYLGLQMAIAESLIPTLTALVTWLGKILTFLAPFGGQLKYVAAGLAAFLAAGKIAKTGSSIVSAIGGIGKAAGGAVGALGRLSGGFKNAQVAQSAFSGKLGTMGGALRKVTDGLVSGAKAALSWVANVVKATAATVAHKVAAIASAAASKIAAAAQWLWNAALTANPIGIIVVAIAAAVAAFVLMYKKVGWFRKGVDAALRVVVKVAKWAFGLISKVVKTVVGFVSKHWKTMLVVLVGPIAIAAKLIIEHWSTIKAAVKAAVAFVLKVVTTVWNALVSVTRKVWGAIKTAVTTVAKGIYTVVSTYFRMYLTVVRTVMNAISSVVRTVWNAIKGAVTTVLKALVGVVRTQWNAMLNVVRSAMNALKGVVSGAARAVVNALRAAWSGLAGIAGKLWSGIKSRVLAALNFYKSMLSAGKKIATGLWDGLKSMAGWLWDKVTGFAKGVFDAVKKGLGKLWPFSPSEAGVDIGYWLGKGIEKGIHDSESAVRAAVSRLGALLVASPEVSPSASPATAGPPAPNRLFSVSPTVATPTPARNVSLDFSGAIFVDSTQAGVERLWNLAVRGAQSVEEQRDRMSAS
jgi:phage-related protein